MGIIGPSTDSLTPHLANVASTPTPPKASAVSKASAAASRPAPDQQPVAPPIAADAADVPLEVVYRALARD